MFEIVIHLGKKQFPLKNIFLTYLVMVTILPISFMLFFIDQSRIQFGIGKKEIVNLKMEDDSTKH
mgnify:CR=1 FL=1